jgi:hypothetical protein
MLFEASLLAAFVFEGAARLPVAARRARLWKEGMEATRHYLLIAYHRCRGGQAARWFTLLMAISFSFLSVAFSSSRFS